MAETLLKQHQSHAAVAVPRAGSFKQYFPRLLSLLPEIPPDASAAMNRGSQFARNLSETRH